MKSNYTENQDRSLEAGQAAHRRRWNLKYMMQVICSLSFLLPTHVLGANGPNKKANPLEGCWEKEDVSTKYPTSLTYCFLANGKLQGWDISDGHGADFYGNWRISKSNRVHILIDDSIIVRCDYNFIISIEEIYLKNCTSLYSNGRYRKSSVNLGKGK